MTNLKPRTQFDILLIQLAIFSLQGVQLVSATSQLFSSSHHHFAGKNMLIPHVNVFVDFLPKCQQLFPDLCQIYLACAMYALFLHIISVHLRQHTRIFLFDALHYEIQECPIGILSMSLECSNFKQGIYVEAICTSTRGTTIQIIPHMQNLRKKLLNAG